MKRELTIPNVLGLTHRPSAYGFTVAALVVAVVVASIIEPPTAYLVPLAVAAWAVLYWTLRRETTPRYRRNRNN
jgi:4-hydroxybenzoate polyprenyltransferase